MSEQGGLGERERFRELFIGVLGHEMRDPLSAIVTGAELLLERGGLDPFQVRVVERIRDSARRMGRMADDVVELTRSRLGGGIPLHRVPTSLADLVRVAVADIQTAHPGRALEQRVEGETRGEWDPDRLAQVVWNLVGNAIVHGDAGAPVRVLVRGEGTSVRLEVRNAGPPIPPDLLPVIFDPFRRAEESLRRHGLGLGLYIAQEIVQTHGGTLTVDSEAERGTTFTALLPRMP
jgi:signal transduction histidine kinase